MRVLVCGGRAYRNYKRVADTLDDVRDSYGTTVIIHGGAKGADDLADIWADEQGLPAVVFAADWDAHGKAAGPLRNQRMIDEGRPDLVVAFPGGRGTADMLWRAERAGIEIVEVLP